MANTTGYFRPFHETVVEEIAHASSQQLEFIAGLLKKTSIPKNHDEILVAFNRRRQEMCWNTEDLGVNAVLTAQKEAVEQEARQTEIAE